MDDLGASDDTTEVRILISGRVQGVGFRWFARERARRLGIGGWAANLEDGSVCVEACGPADTIAVLIAALRQGPEQAQVTDVRTGPRTARTALPRDFTIHR